MEDYQATSEPDHLRQTQATPPSSKQAAHKKKITCSGIHDRLRFVHSCTILEIMMEVAKRPLYDQVVGMCKMLLNAPYMTLFLYKEVVFPPLPWNVFL